MIVGDPWGFRLRPRLRIGLRRDTYLRGYVPKSLPCHMFGRGIVLVERTTTAKQPRTFLRETRDVCHAFFCMGKYG